MSLNQLFELSRRSFRTFDAGMNTAGQNIANADTEGYSRRRIIRRTVSAASPGIHVHTPPRSATGAGVTVQAYERVRDALLDAASWDAQTGLGSAGEETRLLSALEGVLGPTGESGLSDVLGRFWEAWSDVADHPTDTGVRRALFSHAQTLTDTFHRLDSDLTQLHADTQQTLADGIDTVSDLLDQIATLNASIQQARSSGSPDLAAEDERDQLVKELSSFLPLKVQDNEQGYTLSVHGMTVVQGGEATGLELPGPNTPPTHVRFAGTDVELHPASSDDGKVGAWLRTLNTTLPAVRNELNSLVSDLVTRVNEAHENGYGLDNTTSRAFFDPAGLDASSIALHADDRDGLGDPPFPEAIAAASAPDRAGDSQSALAIAGLRKPFDDRAIELIAGVGAQVERATSQATAGAAVVDHLEGMAQGVSGVSLDEEMTHLIQNQQAYAASARVLNAAQEMMDTLLAL